VAIILGVEFAGDRRWLQWAAIIGGLLPIVIGALAAHWNPAWAGYVPPPAVGVWAAGLMLLVPGWIWLSAYAARAAASGG
jgi:hypothetical protein